LTASGGPFADYTKAQLSEVTAEQALQHPTWQMGPKVTIDSATLMNKGFEIFEMKWMFGLEFEQIEVVVHHQSIVHSLVQLSDGNVLAQLGRPDMRLRLDLIEVGSLTFAAPDSDKFPCLRLAREAGRSGQSYPAVLNAADEVAVAWFLQDRIEFMDIPQLIEQALEEHEPFSVNNLSDVTTADQWTRDYLGQIAADRR